MKKMGYDGQKPSNGLIQELSGSELYHTEQAPDTGQDMIPAEQVSGEDSQIIRSDTICIYEHFYLDTNETSVIETGPNSEIAGLTREQLSSYLDDYMANLSLTEYEAGLISYELQSFSNQRVVLRKTYDRTRLQYRFYLTIKNNYVIVYYSDRKTVFEYTGIEMEQIGEQNRILLMEGIFVRDTEELYDVLAGLTS